MGFLPKENSSGIFIKKYADDYCIEVDFEKEIFNFGGKIKIQGKEFQYIIKPEDWVVFECVNRLLDKGYKPENISLEKVYPAGHGTSGRLDICVTHDNGAEYLLIECKTYGSEFTKAFNKLKKDGGQLFTYFKFSNKADLIMLYASELKGDKIDYKNEIVKIEDEYRTGDVKDFYDKWNKLTKDNGVFDEWVNPYNFVSKALTPKLLKPIKQDDSGFIFNRFLEILRHNVVSDKPNAFNKIFTLFLCKVYDEKTCKPNEELKFQWFEGKDKSNGENAYVDFLLRLSDLYKSGMLEFLEKEITDFSEVEFEQKYKHLDDSIKKELLREFNKIRLEKNNEFAIKEVFDKQSFIENGKIIKEVVELLQEFRIRYNKRQQYLSDFFELLLTTGLKQESGQYFTPVPIAQFIIKSLPIIELVNKKLDKGEKDNLLPFIIDYAAGSGHFLTESMHEIQRILDSKKPSDYLETTAKKLRNWQDDHFDWATQYVYGIEKDYRLVKVGKVGCYLHGDGLANVILSDGLGNFENTKEYKGLLKHADSTFAKENKQFDILISNPPYSVPAFKNAARDYYTENDFDLYDRLTDNSSEIECLFIERTKQLLKDGGIAGIILPSSILSNTGIYTKSREIILQYFDIIGICELGSNTFMATGTNTVVLFLRRRNNYESINLKIAVDKIFTTLLDVTTNGIEKPVAKYVNHVWQTISADDYLTLLKKEPNKTIAGHEIYTEYRKKIKARNEKEFWDIVLEKEKEKLFYFIIAYPQKVVLVKTGEKDAEKRFLGYEFSNRRGSEGIHPIQRGKNIEDCTQLFDPEVFDNPAKASTYIYKAFGGDFNIAIDETLQNNISRHHLIDMLTFDRVEFEKNISLSSKKKVKIESKWEQVRLGNITTLITRGKSPKYGKSNIQIIKSGQARGYYEFDFSEKYFVSDDFVLDERKLQKKDLLLNSSGVGTAGRVTYFDLDGDYVVDTHINILRLNQDLINPKYLLNVFGVIGFKTLESLALGQSGQIEISNETIANFKVPLPPKDIQEKIVAEIEGLEEKEKKAKEEVEGLKKSIPQLIESLKNNGLERLENLAIIGSGGTPSMKVQEYWENGNIPWLKSEVCKEGFVTEAKDFITDLGLKNSNAKYFEKNSTLIALVGATKGKTAFLKFRATTNQNIAGITSLNKEKILNEYIFYVLKGMYSEIIKDLAQYDMLNLTMIKNIKIPLPTLSEQQKIVSEIEKIEEEINQLEKAIAEIPEQKEAILKKYL